MEKISAIALKIYKIFSLRGYARIDLRLYKNKPYFFDVNPNPDLSPDAGFAKGAYYAGLDYDSLIDEIVKLGLERKTFQGFY